MKVIGVIPARYKSSRFPGKPLVKILGKPMIIHVLELSVKALGKDNVWVATDDDRIFNEVESWGYQAIMTSEMPKTGTDRLWEVAQKIPADFYINIQGDEPMLNPADIQKIRDARIASPDTIINGFCPIGPNEDPESVNIPKVIFDENHRMIYMSRKALPGVKAGLPPSVYYKQVCIYAFNYNELKAFGERDTKTYLESFEDIEILRFLEMGYPIRMVETSGASLAVDEPGDVAKVEAALSAPDK